MKKYKKPISQTHKELMKEWDYKKNNKLGLDPKKLTKGSGKKAYWKCKRGHKWEAKISNRCYNHRGCPYCSGHKVCKENCLAIRNSKLSEEWNYNKNTLTPYDITSKSNKEVWWVCSEKHEWKISVNHRAAGNGCPCCSGYKSSKEHCFAVVNPILSREWNYKKNILTPYDVTPNSGKIVHWICGRGHEWKVSVISRNKGSECPYCSNRKVNKENCLAAINPILSEEWDIEKNGGMTPKEIIYGSPKRVWWICNKCKHGWKASIVSRNKGIGCPYCINKNEGKVKELLFKYFKNWNIIPHKKIWDKYKDYNHKRYCDFWLDKDGIKVIVEYDGEQHFRPVSFGCKDKIKVANNFKMTQIKDKFDTKFCKENNIILHRIRYNEDKEESVKRLQLSIYA